MKINTSECMRDMISALDVTQAQAAKIFRTSKSALHHYLSGRRSPPTLDTLASYAHRAHQETGMVTILTVTPDMNLHYNIDIGIPGKEKGGQTGPIR